MSNVPRWALSAIRNGTPSSRRSASPSCALTSVVAERVEPCDTFGGHEKLVPWDPLHGAYFSGYALWTCMDAPFLLAMDGAVVEEFTPSVESGETWRVLRAYFPQTMVTLGKRQDFFFAPI